MTPSVVYRLVLRPTSSFVSSLQSDGFTGHLAWMTAYRQKGNDISEFLDKFSGTPPFVLSSGMPHNRLPMPVLPPLTGQEKETLAKKHFPDQPDSRQCAPLHCFLKEMRGLAFLPLECWHELQKGLSGYGLADYLLDKNSGSPQRRGTEYTKELETQFREHNLMRTAVSRITGSGLEGQLFDRNEFFYAPGTEVDIWFKFFIKDSIDPVRRWLDDLAQCGYGAKTTSGAGQFEIISFQEDTTLPQPEKANGYMSLSHFVPAADDPTRGWYNHIVKRGKTGGIKGAAPGPSTPGANVWKSPLVMFTPGSVFRLNNSSLRKYYGRLVRNIHPLDSSIVQFCHAFPLPVHIESTREEP